MVLQSNLSMSHQSLPASIISCNKIKMWNLISSSKIAEERTRKKNYDLHREKLANMRPKMQVCQPEQPDFVYLKPKLQMARRDKLSQIDRQNDILFSKMLAIKNAKYTQNKLRPQAQQLTTLNQHVMSLQAQDIENQNKRFCAKLLRIGSHYPTFETIGKAQKLQSIRENISQNARRVKSVRNLRPQSSYTSRSSKFYRSRVNKYDLEGNSSQEKINILYKMNSQADLRPESAPTAKRNLKDRYSSHRPELKFRKTAQNQQQLDNKEEDLTNYATIREGKLQGNSENS